MRDPNTLYLVIFLLLVVGPPVLKAILKVLNALSEQAKRTAAGGEERGRVEELAPWIREPSAGGGGEESSSNNPEEQRPVKFPWESDFLSTPVSPQSRPRQVAQPIAPLRTGRTSSPRARVQDAASGRRPAAVVKARVADTTPPQILELLGSELAARLHAPGTRPYDSAAPSAPPAQAHTQRSQGESGRTHGGSRAQVGRAEKIANRALPTAVIWSEILAPPLSLRGPWQ